jgi:soluble lytic murein transglycosylase-like protein
MDSWRAEISAQLDQEIAKLKPGSSNEAVTLLRLDRNPPAAPIPKEATGSGPAEGTAPLQSMIARLLGQQGLPTSLRGVVKVESAFNPSALSPKGALGLWQLMPETARRYGLAVSAHGDDRLDPVKATVAAAAYLRDLYTRFRNWPLALAAYNAGANRVQQAIDRLGTRDFWTLSRELALPEETRQYVPRVLSASRTDSYEGTGSHLLFPVASAGGTPAAHNDSSQNGRVAFATVSPDTTKGSAQ